MEQFVILFRTDNAAFDDTPATEIARILRSVAARVESGDLGGAVADVNGNTIGYFEATRAEGSE